MASIREDALAAKSAASSARSAAQTPHERYMAEALEKLADATLKIGTKLSNLEG